MSPEAAAAAVQEEVKNRVEQSERSSWSRSGDYTW